MSSRKQKPVRIQTPQAIQPAIGFLPKYRISVSIPPAFRVDSSSRKAVYVHPSLFGLPLINNTFIRAYNLCASSSACLHPSVLFISPISSTPGNKTSPKISHFNKDADLSIGMRIPSITETSFSSQQAIIPHFSLQFSCLLRRTKTFGLLRLLSAPG